MNVRSKVEVTQSGIGLFWRKRELTTKIGKQPWPQLMYCAVIMCMVAYFRRTKLLSGAQERNGI